MIFNQQGVSGGGGSVETAHVYFESMADHVWWTDASMTLHDSPFIDEELPIGTLIATVMSMLMPEGGPSNCELIASEITSGKGIITVYQVTG